MNNRFDEMVLDAVEDVASTFESASQSSSSKKPEPEAKKVVSIEKKSDTDAKPLRRMSKQAPQRAGNGDDAALTLARGLTRPLVTKTVRFRPELAEALNTIVLKNKLSGQKPDTIQDVVNDAAQAWVKAHKLTH